MKFNDGTRTGTTIKIKENHQVNPHLSPENYYYDAISDMVKAGGWSLDFINKKSFLDRQARKILKVPNHYAPSLRDGQRFYAEGHKQKAEALFIGCSNGRPFMTEILMKTYTGEVFWARAQGKPIRNSKDEIVGIRGVFHNIDLEKKKEQPAESDPLIVDNGAWLKDLSNILVHALRSQIGNLQLSSALIEKGGMDKDQKALFSNIDSIGHYLDTTLQHLDALQTTSKCKSIGGNYRYRAYL